MRYSQFVDLVRARGWSVPQLRCDVTPTQEVLDLMDNIGLEKFEDFVMRYSRLDVTSRPRHRLLHRAPRLALEQSPPD
jgi:hypothetical protein